MPVFNSLICFVTVAGKLYSKEITLLLQLHLLTKQRKNHVLYNSVEELVFEVVLRELNVEPLGFVYLWW